jgi:diaminopropionate ammonia-lyase
MDTLAPLDVSAPLRLLAACPAHRPTPLRRLPAGAGADVLVKDETGRMGLGSFKALGGVYAVFRIVADRAGLAVEPASADAPAFRDAAAGLVFVCASAGNHGLSVAAGAAVFGARARVHLSETVPEGFAARLRAKGAQVVRSGADYEASIAAAIRDAAETGAIHLADGSWPGYVARPRLIMEGYTVMADELRRDFEAGGEWPTHLFLQAGVGGMAGAVADMVRRSWTVQPEIVVVEPEAAPCLAASHAAGRPTRADGPVSCMGRLDCKEPSIIAFSLLEAAGVSYATVSDAEAEAACAALEAEGVLTTPSGAAGYAALTAQSLPAGARPLVVASEGRA